MSSGASKRGIGLAGTLARFLVGAVFLAVLLGRPSWPSVAIGLLGFPLVLLVGQWGRLRFTRVPLQATGSIGFTVNALVFAALYLAPLYAAPVRFISDGVLIFYGASMIVAAIRGYRGCEVLAVSNWLLRRNDQVGCVLFSPLDTLESRAVRRSPANHG